MEEDLTEEKIQEFLTQSPEWYYYGYTKPPLRVWLLTPVILEDTSTSPPQPPPQFDIENVKYRHSWNKPDLPPLQPPPDPEPIDTKEESEDNIGP